MPYALNFYRDQIGAAGATTEALPAAHRLVYARHGVAVVNGVPLQQGEARYISEPVTMQSAGAWSELWRWDLLPPNIEPPMHCGAGVLSQLRMAQVISAIALDEGTQWLFRLDQIKSAAGRVSNPHRPCPGIRCLLEGEFNIHQGNETSRDLQPGDPWWESGTEDVVAWGSQHMEAVIMRAMIVPPELEGKPTGKWQSQASGNWTLLVDQLVRL